MSRKFGSPVQEIHAELLASGLLERVSLGGADERLWADCALASMAENRLGDRTDPRSIDEARREQWRLRATDSDQWPPSERVSIQSCYWLLRGGRRVGTIAIDDSTLGATALHLGDLYVFPTDRGLGVTRAALGQLRDALGRRGMSLRLHADWTWQRSTRLYVRMGMWLRMWKRGLQFDWRANVPPPIFGIHRAEARLSAIVGGAEVVLQRATRAGDMLELEYQEPSFGPESPLYEASHYSASTLALGLALAGWPLLRSTHSELSRYADAGPPEALARKIVVWEAYDRSLGWRVETPRIPGLSYPTWEELEAEWDKGKSALDASEPRSE
ncbi:MAG: GNAT family N-acetyltransferase [Deltaproteobacteria bacterium]|nr:GNAT family N-acetyltransferase [Deltaproteobacteria bacterium]